MEQFNTRLKKAMQIKGKKQVDLVGATGISKSMISEYVKGKFVPKQDNLYLIAKALNVEEAWLMGFDDVGMDPVGHQQGDVYSELNFFDLADFICVAADKPRAEYKHLYQAILTESEELNTRGFEKTIEFIQLLKHDDSNTID